MATKSKKSQVKKTNTRVSVKRLTRNPKLNIGILAIIAGVLAIGGILFVLLTRAATPTSYTTAGQATAALDNSGKTIPKTNYAIPTGATYMSTTGNDANDGKTVNTPVKTINAAVAKTAAGGTIVMRGGEYRDWYQPNGYTPGLINKSLTIQAYPGESPWFNGSDIVSDGWTSDGAGHWYRQWDTPTFCGGQYYNYTIAPYTPQRRADGTTDPNIKQTTCMYEDAANDPAYPMAGDPQQVFMNDARQQEVASLAQVTDGKFYYDWAARKIYIGADPAGKKVELSARPAAFILTGADTDTHALKGIGFKRYATNGSEGTFTGGAVYITRKTLIENSVFAENATNGIAFSSPKPGTVFRNSVVAFNGGTGMGANGSSSNPAGVRNDFVVESSIFNSNNWERGGLNCNRACGPAGIKMAHMVGFTVRNNVFENQFSRAPGMWCDQNCSDMVTVNNIVRNNGGTGIFYEVGNKGIIANNLIYNNDDDGITVASANVKVYNNTIVDKPGNRVQGINVYDDPRTPPSATSVWPWYDGAHDNGPSTAGVELVNNLLASPDTQNGARLVNAGNYATGALNTTADKYFSAFDYNAYYRLNTSQNLYLYLTTDGYKYVTDMQRLSGGKFEMNSFSVEANSPFLDRAGEDFRLKTDAKAATMLGAPLPADVAAAINLPAGMTPVRGAIYPVSAPTTTSTVTPPPTTTVAPPADTIAPVGPTSLTASSVGQTSLILNWSAATDNVGVTQYVLTRNGTQIATGPSLSSSDSGLTAGTTYQYKVVAIDAAGNTSTGATLTVATLPAPSPSSPPPPPPPPTDMMAPTVPTNVKATVNYDALRFAYYTNLTWAASTDNVGVKNYQVKRNGTVLGAPTGTNFQDYTLQANTYYIYEVFAQDAAGNTSAAGNARLVGRCFLIWCWAG